MYRIMVKQAKHKNIGFVSFRFAGTDGVSLETFKWAEVFEKQGFTCYYMAGELETAPQNSFLVEEAHFAHPEIKKLYNLCMGPTIRDRSTTTRLHKYRELLKDRLYEFVRKFDIHILVAENSLTIPLNIPFGMALTELFSPFV